MNLAFSKTLSSNRKRLPWPYISLIAGLGLALTTAVAGGALSDESSSRVSGVRASAGQVEFPQPSVSRYVLYIVGTELEASILADLMYDDQYSTCCVPASMLDSIAYSFLVIDSDEKEPFLSMFTRELAQMWAHGDPMNVEVIDVRS